MIASGSEIIVGAIPFILKGIIGDFVELETVQSSPDGDKRKVYVPLVNLMEYEGFITVYNLAALSFAGDWESKDTGSEVRIS